MLNDEYEVELLQKLPRYHRNIYEFQQISKADTPELKLLLKHIDTILSNWFIDTADDYGISRLEKIAGIIPNSSVDLELRKFNLLLKMSEKLPYTDETLEERLTSLCGAGNYSVFRDYDNYFLSILTALEDGNIFDSMIGALDKMIPCNLVLEVKNVVTASSTGVTYTGGVVTVRELISVTNNIQETLDTTSKVYTGAVDKVYERLNIR
jgi:hypothetical protein